jgi:hypothetical protein
MRLMCSDALRLGKLKSNSAMTSTLADCLIEGDALIEPFG